MTSGLSLLRMLRGSRRRPRRRRLLGAALLLLLLAFVLPRGLFLAMDRAFPLPGGALHPLDASPVVTTADGAVMHVGLTRDEARWMPVSGGAISPRLFDAVVASEDRRFFSHGGVDVVAVLRAAVANVTGGGARQGASTITMQLARLCFGMPRTLAGKAEQAFRALQLERAYTKREILAAYLNRLPLGGNLRGAQAAARAFFGQAAKDLDASQAALLASVLPAPGRWAPGRDAPGALARRDRVLDRMHAEGFLEDGAWRAAKARPLGLVPTAFPDFAPHAWLRVGEGRSTIDRSAQRALEAVAAAAGGVDGLALVLVENDTCAVRALVGARDANARLLDATGRPRSAGSTFKPFLYALAFDRGRATPDTRLLDLPWRARDWQPGNFDRTWRGPVPAAEALANSYNLPAVRLAAAVGPGALAATLRRAGCRHVRPPGRDPGVDLALGTDDVTPLELAGAYAALARGGRWRAPWLARPGAAATETRRVCSPGAARLVTRILADPTRPRPDGGAAEGLAWKTGTSSRRRDAWAAGYTRRYTAVVWRGRLDGRPDASLVGARAATPLLFAALQAVDPTPAPFDDLGGRQHGLEPIEVCAETGRACTDRCPARITSIRPTGARALRACPVHRRLPVDRESGHLVCEHCRRDRSVEFRPFALHPPALALWRRSVGLPTPPLPPHETSCPDPLEPEVLKPVFVSPSDAQVFALAGETASVPVCVLAAEGSDTLRILLDGHLVLETRPDTPSRLPVRAGRHLLQALTRRGHAAALHIVVR